MRSALITFVLPRSAPEAITRFWFRFLRRLFDLRLRWAKDYLTQDRVMALYAPLALLSLLPIWLVIVTIGFGCLYWATGLVSRMEDLILSGSSLLTLGFARGETFTHDLLAFAEATLGLILVAVLIAYLPTMYSAFARRAERAERDSRRRPATSHAGTADGTASRLHRPPGAATGKSFKTPFVHVWRFGQGPAPVVQRPHGHPGLPARPSMTRRAWPATEGFTQRDQSSKVCCARRNSDAHEDHHSRSRPMTPIPFDAARETGPSLSG